MNLYITTDKLLTDKLQPLQYTNGALLSEFLVPCLPSNFVCACVPLQCLVTPLKCILLHFVALHSMQCIVASANKCVCGLMQRNALQLEIIYKYKYKCKSQKPKAKKTSVCGLMQWNALQLETNKPELLPYSYTCLHCQKKCSDSLSFCSKLNL